MIENLNYTTIPNVVIDEHLRKLSGASTKIILAVCRKTIGWHKISDRISYAQLHEITGISSHNTLRKGIDELLKAGLISAHRGQGKTSIIDICISATRSKSDTVEPQTRSKSDYTKERKSIKKLEEVYSSEFDIFWKTYPKHTNKRGSYRKWQECIGKNIPSEELIACAQNYKTSVAGSLLKFVMKAETFLGPDERYKEFATIDTEERVPDNSYGFPKYACIDRECGNQWQSTSSFCAKCGKLGKMIVDNKQEAEPAASMA